MEIFENSFVLKQENKFSVKQKKYENLEKQFVPSFQTRTGGPQQNPDGRHGDQGKVAQEPAAVVRQEVLQEEEEVIPLCQLYW